MHLPVSVFPLRAESPQWNLGLCAYHFFPLSHQKGISQSDILVPVLTFSTAILELKWRLHVKGLRSALTAVSGNFPM